MLNLFMNKDTSLLKGHMYVYIGLCSYYYYMCQFDPGRPGTVKQIRKQTLPKVSRTEFTL